MPVCSAMKLCSSSQISTRSQLIRDSALTKTDLLEIATYRGEAQRLGFAYQLGFVRLFQRFPVQQGGIPMPAPQARWPQARHCQLSIDTRHLESD